ncbi:MAG: putative thymidylate kinase [Candidatus Thorarchaeota archaeon]|nr:MAG: putative thymidylate kinase [Candidatus Thorarchaeota archaeon]
MHRTIIGRRTLVAQKTGKDYPGYLFVLEGIDGAGKTAVCRSVAQNLTEMGFQVAILREPTDESKWGKEIRRRSPMGELTPSEELDLFIKDRDWNIRNRLIPALKDGKIVLMDRYFFATGAYQSTSTGLHWSEILKKNREGIAAIEPDIVFILDISAEEGLCRVTGRGCETNQQFEKHDRLVEVRKAYLEMVKSDWGNYFVIDATFPLKEVVSLVKSEIIRFMKENARKSL